MSNNKSVEKFGVSKATEETKNAQEEGQEEEKGQESSESPSTSKANSQEPPAPAPSAWQAIFSPQHNAYYFFNTQTNETTWTNPLQPPAEASQPSSSDASATPEPEADVEAETSTQPVAGPSKQALLQQAALAAGIDPALAYLDPTLQHSLPTPGASIPGQLPVYTAKFNARTGQFARPDARDPSHMGEFERAKRMSEFYFDVEAWERQRDAVGGSTMAVGEDPSKKRKRPTKKDVERFKEQKKQKKLAKTAWLRE